jgi:N-acetylglucosaminyldiphosphoundecaprenol N-acetyl-beta-D-mannosaminyltransferase
VLRLLFTGKPRLILPRFPEVKGPAAIPWRNPRDRIAERDRISRKEVGVHAHTLSEISLIQGAVAAVEPHPAAPLFSFSPPVNPSGAPSVLLGVPFDNVTIADTVGLIEQMIASRQPHYLVTANVDFLIQALHDVELRRILFEAHLVLCDGTPLLWASRWLGNALPERVAGSDLVPLLIQAAAKRGYRLFFLGGTPESTSAAVTRLQIQHPELVIAGQYSPPFRDLLEMDHQETRRRILAARPDLLFVSFGCPKQEKWIGMHYRSLGVPVAIGVGGTIDFLAGRMARAPQWMRRTGTEWLYRLMQEPRRLAGRYARDCWYFGGLLAAQWCRTRLRRPRGRGPSESWKLRENESWREIHCPERLDAETARQEEPFWDRAGDKDCLLDLSQVRFIDSTGVGLLVRLQKRARRQDRMLVLIAPSPAATQILRSMRLWPFFLVATTPAHARELLKESSGLSPAQWQSGPRSRLAWQGEVTAANADLVWNATEACLLAESCAKELEIDLSRVGFVDSTGLGLMVRAKKLAAKTGVSVKFSGARENVLNVIELAKLEDYLFGTPSSPPAASSKAVQTA